MARHHTTTIASLGSRGDKTAAIFVAVALHLTGAYLMWNASTVQPATPLSVSATVFVTLAEAAPAAAAAPPPSETTEAVSPLPPNPAPVEPTRPSEPESIAALQKPVPSENAAKAQEPEPLTTPVASAVEKNVAPPLPEPEPPKPVPSAKKPERPAASKPKPRAAPPKVAATPAPSPAPAVADPAPVAFPAPEETAPLSVAATAHSPASPSALPVPIEEPPRFDVAYLNNPKPTYPALSRRLGEEGRVGLRVLVGIDGLPQQVEIHHSSGYERLDRAARNAVTRWRFVPARQGNRPVSAWVQVPIVFRLQDQI